MPALALFDALKDFAPQSQQARAARSDPQRAEPLLAERKALDLDAIVAQRVAVVEAALREGLAREHAAALSSLAEEHAATLEQLNRRFGEEIGRTVALKIAEAEARVTEFAVASLARAVGGVLTDDVQKRSIEALAAAIREAMADRDAVRIRIRGPQSLFEALHGALGGRAGSLDFAEAPGFDLSVSIDGNPIETRLAEWSAGLSEILA